MIMSNLNDEFTFEVIDQPIEKTTKPNKKKENSVVKDISSDCVFVLPETFEFEEIDEFLITSKKGQTFKPTFNHLLSKHIVNGVEYTNKHIITPDSKRDYNNENDWDLLRSLVIMKCVRRNRRKEKVVLDDIVEFRLLPKQWAEDLCEYLFRNDFNFIVYEENNRW